MIFNHAQSLGLSRDFSSLSSLSSFFFPGPSILRPDGHSTSTLLIASCSTNPTSQFTFRQSALDMHALLDHLGIGQFKGIGISAHHPSPARSQQGGPGQSAATGAGAAGLVRRRGAPVASSLCRQSDRQRDLRQPRRPNHPTLPPAEPASH